MRKFRKQLIPLVSLLVAVVLVLGPGGLVFAANPTVSMNVTAGIISINNTQDTWALGTAVVDEVVYFSADGAQDDTYSTLGNDGTVIVDVEIQGTDFAGSPITWTLAAAPTKDTFSLYANSDEAGTYDIEVKSSAYNDLKASLGVDLTWDWSMKFTAPDEYDGTEAGDVKTATLTLVASES